MSGGRYNNTAAMPMLAHYTSMNNCISSIYILIHVPPEITIAPARMMMRWLIYFNRKGVIHWNALWNKFMADRPAYKSFTEIEESFRRYYDAT